MAGRTLPATSHEVNRTFSTITEYLNTENTLSRSLCRHNRRPTTPQALREIQHQNDLVHTRTYARNLPGGMCYDPRRRTRDVTPLTQPAMTPLRRGADIEAEDSTATRTRTQPRCLSNSNATSSTKPTSSSPISAANHPEAVSHRGGRHRRRAPR